MQKFDGIFNGDDVFGAGGVDAVDHGGEGGRLARSGDAGHEHQSARHVADLFDDFGKKQFIEGADFGGNDAEDEPHIAALLEDVDTEPSQAGDAISHIDFGGLFEFLFLARRHHAEGHVQHVFRGDARLFGERQQVAINAQVGVISHL